MNKNDICNLEIIDNGCAFEGIAKVNHQVIFVPNAIVGEKVKAKIIKTNKSYAIGKIEEILEESTFRNHPFCEVANLCGGCSAQHIQYDFQLLLKNKMVSNVLEKNRVPYAVLNATIGMGMPYYYRNKVQYPVRCENGETKLGFYSKRSHRIVQNVCCYIQNRVIDMVAKEIFDELIQQGFVGYEEETSKGDIRHIMIRRGYHTGEMMLVLIVNREELLYDSRLLAILQKIASQNSDIKSVYINWNASKTNEILGKEFRLIAGEEYIHDTIGHHTYAISPKSFFQVNTLQAEVLYSVLKDMLSLQGDEILFDLYSGVGSIGIFLSNAVKQVYGIEIEEQAVAMANINLRRNHVRNAEYIAGSVEEKIEEYRERGIKPDVIVVDPPRKGLDLHSIEYILNFAPKKIGYVSCNPATLARDLKLLSSQYEIMAITPVDMFPQTNHVECCSVLSLKNSIQ